MPLLQLRTPRRAPAPSGHMRAAAIRFALIGAAIATVSACGANERSTVEPATPKSTTKNDVAPSKKLPKASASTLRISDLSRGTGLSDPLKDTVLDTGKVLEIRSTSKQRLQGGAERPPTTGKSDTAGGHARDFKTPPKRPRARLLENTPSYTAGCPKWFKQRYRYHRSWFDACHRRKTGPTLIEGDITVSITLPVSGRKATVVTSQVGKGLGNVSLCIRKLVERRLFETMKNCRVSYLLQFRKP